MQMEQNSKYLETDWLLIQRKEFDKERQIALKLRYHSNAAPPPSNQVEPVVLPSGLRRRPENHALGGISKGWLSRSETFLPSGHLVQTSATSPKAAASAAVPREVLMEHTSSPATNDHDDICSPGGRVTRESPSGRARTGNGGPASLAAIFADFDGPQRRASRTPKTQSSAPIPTGDSISRPSSVGLRRGLLAPETMHLQGSPSLHRSGSTPNLQGPTLRDCWSSSKSPFVGCRRSSTGNYW